MNGLSKVRERHEKITCLPVYTIDLGLLFLISDDSKIDITIHQMYFVY